MRAEADKPKHMEDLKTFLIEQIDGDNDYYAKILKGFVKDIKAFEKKTKADLRIAKQNLKNVQGGIIWVGRIDEVYGDSMIAFGKSEKEVENLLFKDYKAVGKAINEMGYGYNNNGQKTKAELLEYFGAWIQPMAIGKCYSSDDDEARNLKNQKK